MTEPFEAEVTLIARHLRNTGLQKRLRLPVNERSFQCHAQKGLFLYKEMDSIIALGKGVYCVCCLRMLDFSQRFLVVVYPNGILIIF